MTNALPTSERPPCWWCGKKLPPDYESVMGDGPIKIRKLAANEMESGSSSDPRNTPKWSIHFDDKENKITIFPEFKNGFWRVKYQSQQIMQRKFKGTYGLNNLFCSKVHAALWAVENADAILHNKFKIPFMMTARGYHEEMNKYKKEQPT